MFNFGRNKQADNAYLERLADQITELTKQVAALKGERDAQKQAKTLEDKVLALKQEIETLKIARSTLEEKNAREQRELQHMIGLEKKRGEWEIQRAKEETTLQVERGNLDAEQLRFDRDMEFREKRFSSEVTYIKELMEKIMDRLPVIEVNLEKSVGSAKEE